MQATQLDDEPTVWYWPAAHEEQTVDPVLENVPAGQAGQKLAPVEEE